MFFHLFTHTKSHRHLNSNKPSKNNRKSLFASLGSNTFHLKMIVYAEKTFLFHCTNNFVHFSKTTHKNQNIKQIYEAFAVVCTQSKCVVACLCFLRVDYVMELTTTFQDHGPEGR